MGHWRHALEGDSGTLAPFPPLCFLATTRKQLALPCAPTLSFFITSSKITVSGDHELAARQCKVSFFINRVSLAAESSLTIFQIAGLMDLLPGPLLCVALTSYTDPARPTELLLNRLASQRGLQLSVLN